MKVPSIWFACTIEIFICTEKCLPYLKKKGLKHVKRCCVGDSMILFLISVQFGSTKNNIFNIIDHNCEQLFWKSSKIVAKILNHETTHEII